MRFLSRGHRAQAPAARVHRYGTAPDGSRNTIHESGRLNIEVDALGRPIALWFRCLNLPFTIWHRTAGEPAHINPHDMTVLNIEYEEKPDV